MAAAEVDDVHEHVEVRRGGARARRVGHDARRVRPLHAPAQVREHAVAPFGLREQLQRFGRERARPHSVHEAHHVGGVGLRVLEQQHIHAISHVQGGGQELHLRALPGEQVVVHMVEQHDFGVIDEGRQLPEKEEPVERMLPHALGLERHHAVDFLGAVRPDIVEQRHEVGRAALRFIVGALHRQHGVEDGGNAQPVIHES